MISVLKYSIWDSDPIFLLQLVIPDIQNPDPDPEE